MITETNINPIESHRFPKTYGVVLIAMIFLLTWNCAAFAAGEIGGEGGELSITISYQGKTIAEYLVVRIPLEQLGDEYDAQLPESDNWLICDKEYIVFYFERTKLKKGYLPPISVNGLQLLYENGETIDAIPHEEVSFRLNEELAENEGLVFLPIPQTVAPPEKARFSYSIREDVPKIYGGTKSVRILEMGEVVKEIDEEDWIW